jgi:RHS repeat-associated protein
MVCRHCGSKAAEVRYRAWGEDRYTSGTSPTSYRYAGHRVEASLGLYYYGVRWYDSSLGRFLSADTIVPNPGDPQAWDRYAAMNNNPVVFVDPSGHLADQGGGASSMGEDWWKKRQDKLEKSEFARNLPDPHSISHTQTQQARLPFVPADTPIPGVYLNPAPTSSNFPGLSENYSQEKSPWIIGVGIGGSDPLGGSAMGGGIEIVFFKKEIALFTYKGKGVSAGFGGASSFYTGFATSGYESTEDYSGYSHSEGLTISPIFTANLFHNIDNSEGGITVGISPGVRFSLNSLDFDYKLIKSIGLP